MVGHIWDKAVEAIPAFATLWTVLYATGTLELLGLALEDEPEAAPMAEDVVAVLYEGPIAIDTVALMGGIVIASAAAVVVWLTIHQWRNETDEERQSGETAAGG